MNIVDVIKHPVMDLTTASTVGRIDDVAVDPTSRRVVGFHLAKTTGKATWLPWEHITALGTDAATVANAGVVLPAEAGNGGRRLRGDKVLGGRVLTDEGSDLGSLADIAFDAETGEITSLSLVDGQVLLGSSLLGIGSYATVVEDPNRSPQSVTRR